MAVQPSTSGYLSRTTNLPSNATGWALCFWFRKTADVGAGIFETIFEIVDNGDSDYIKVFIDGDTEALMFETVNNFESVTLFTPTNNVWYFVCLRTASATTGDVLWRADTATSLSSSSGRKFQTDGGWDAMVFLDHTGFIEPAVGIQALALKLFIGTLTDAEVWEQSVRMLPKVAPSKLDSYLPLYTGSGTDEGGRARDWTVTGTLSTVTTQPRISRGGVSRARVSAPASSVAPVTLSLATATGTAHTPGVTGTQPATLPLATASATAPAFTALARQPATLPLASATAAALALSASSNVQLPLASAAATAPALTASAVQPATLPLASATATAPAFTALARQPVLLQLAQAAATAHSFVVQSAAVVLPLVSGFATALTLTAVRRLLGKTAGGLWQTRRGGRRGR